MLSPEEARACDRVLAALGDLQAFEDLAREHLMGPVPFGHASGLASAPLVEDRRCPTGGHVGGYIQRGADIMCLACLVAVNSRLQPQRLGATVGPVKEG